jgi:hypothetical protein
MTLIQTLWSDHLVLQVSDRRLTSGLTGDVVDDAFTKLVCWNFNFSIGFTGIARIDRWGRQSTSEWIAETICDYGVLEDGARALAQAASERISKLPRSWPDRRLGMVIAGFDGRPDGLVVEVTNFVAGGSMPADPTKFEIRVYNKLAAGPVAYVATGARTTAKWQKQLLLQRVPRALAKGTPESITYAVKLMVAVQRDIARSNRTVGTDAMAVMIPRTTFGEQMMRILNGGMIMSSGTGVMGASAGPEFIYFDTQGFNHQQFGPHSAAWGMAMADLISAHEPDRPDYQRVSIKTLKVPPQHTRCTWAPTRASR